MQQSYTRMEAAARLDNARRDGQFAMDARDGHPSSAVNPGANHSDALLPPDLADRIQRTAKAVHERQKSQRAASAFSTLRAGLSALRAADAAAMQAWPSLPVPNVALPGCIEWPGRGADAGIDEQHQTRPLPPTHVTLSEEGVVQTHSGRTVAVATWVLPLRHPVPPYKSWINLRRNQVALDVGQRMFYTDCVTGETVPASDEDEEPAEVDYGRREALILYGSERDITNATLAAVVRELGSSERVIKELAKYLDIEAEAVTQRIAQLEEAAAVAAQGEAAPLWDRKKESFEELQSDFHAAFCRMCRAFGCRTHSGGHPTPRRGPIVSAGDVGAAQVSGGGGAARRRRSAGQSRSASCLCGPYCYRLLASDEADWLSTEAVGRCPTEEQVGSISVVAATVDLAEGGAASSMMGGGMGESAVAGGGRAEAVSADCGEVNSPPEKPSPLPARHPAFDAILPSAAASAALGEHPGSRAAARTLGDAAAAQLAASHSAPMQQRGRPSGVSAVASALETAPSSSSRRPKPSNADGGGRATAATAATAAGGWGKWEDEMLRSGVAMWGQRPCRIAELVGSKTCAQVHCRMEAMPAVTEVLVDDADAEEGVEGLAVPQRRRRKGGARKAAPPAVTHLRHKRREELWLQYSPCDCAGPCTTACSCHGDINFCEKFCACDPATCGNRFLGCSCKYGHALGRRCFSRSCPCMAAGRECDPDLCSMCVSSLDGGGRLPEGGCCSNVRVRARQKRRIIMARSGVQGWGAFLHPGATKEDYLGEYCGELVDHAEADRRGKVYDRDDNSYLFNLNAQWVIDARRKGNKLRFANHATSANCRAEIVMVDGDHRVAIVANRDIAPGEELFYDYRYDHMVAPNWAQEKERREREKAAGVR